MTLTIWSTLEFWSHLDNIDDFHIVRRHVLEDVDDLFERGVADGTSHDHTTFTPTVSVVI